MEHLDKLMWIRQDGSTPERVVDDRNARIIRYMEISQLVQLLTTSCLYFTRVDKFEDAYEGNAIFGMENKDKFGNWAKSCFVNCWSHFYGTEFYPLWKVYVGSSRSGVAIVNKVDLVFDSINPTDREHIQPNIVNYLPIKFDAPQRGSVITNAITKKEFYAYEREIRLTHYTGIRKEEWGDIPEVLKINVDLSKLIGMVIFSPFNKAWVNDSIKQLFEKFGLSNIEYKNSEILLNQR